MSPLLIYGTQRTCTNLVKRLLVDSTDAVEANGEHDGRGWKHALPAAGLLRQPIDGHEPRVILCVREPHAWLRSCWDYFSHHKGADRTVCPHFRRGWGFAAFCRQPHYTWPNPVARWNEFYRLGWELIEDLRSDDCPAAIVRAEDLATQAGQLAELLRLVDVLRLELRGTPRAIRGRVDNRGRITGKPYRAGEYAARIAMHWTADLRAWVEDQLDYDLCRRFGY